MTTRTERAAQLDMIAKQIGGWLEWHKSHRDQEHLVTDGDTNLMALPVPVWPNHRQFENWIECLNDSAEKLRS